MVPSSFSFLLSYPLSRALARRTLSSIKAEGIDGEMIEHCAPQCSSMYKSALRAQREYVIHRSNWTMIDDVTFPSPSLRPVSTLFVVFSFFLFLSLLLSLSTFPTPPLREVVILRKLNIALETHNPRGSLSHLFAFSLTFPRLSYRSLLFSLSVTSERVPLHPPAVFLPIPFRSATSAVIPALSRSWS